MWEELVERVRQIPQFQYFLWPMPFHQLCQAVIGGQIIIINASEYTVDAMIFSDAGPIRCVPLSDIDLETLTELSKNIMFKQPPNASASQELRYMVQYMKPTVQFGTIS